jgi:hypothetical protein
MSRGSISLSIFGIALALALVLGVNTTQAGTFGDRQSMGVDRDLGAFHMNDANQFGVDTAYNLPGHPDIDADARASFFAPQTYGLQGNYGWNQGGN